VSDEAGTNEVYVCSFPVPGEKHRVTTSGGQGAMWSQDGRELLTWTGGGFANSFGTVLSVEIGTTPSFRAGAPRVRFTPRRDIAGFTATRDLRRFLVAVPVEGAAAPSIEVMLDWQEALKR
jgi:hypothetical protein